MTGVGTTAAGGAAAMRGAPAGMPGESGAFARGVRSTCS
ncbi:hypothetical protein RSPO_m01447 (plasmid) [Ralstonia solanacearum Po82]|uniref:Uncharacterized protein n=1 Tax=Ralstonia solanacearum (strain Po82) TaxID=1031711 RepID=F6GAU8_RALS8|nr:hypothetical protein RSPO_m01447 [Ralstonia solanacearum Po82]